MECATFTQVVQLQLTEEDVMHINVHIVPMTSCTSSTATSPLYSWFADKENQELLVLVCDAILSKAQHNSEVTKYQLKRSRNLRVLFNFKPFESRQHLVIPQHPEVFSGLVPRAAFVSNEGRKVLPFLNQRTKGSGYRSFRTLGTCMEVYVDCYSPTDSRGILKIMRKLGTHQLVDPDLNSFFQPISSSEPTLDDVSNLGEIPILALKVGQAKRKRVVKRDTKKLGSAYRGVSLPSANQLLQKYSVKSASERMERGAGLTFGESGTTTVGSTVSVKESRSGNDSEGKAIGVCHNPVPVPGPESECVDLTEEAINDFCDFGSQGNVPIPEEDGVDLRQDEEFMKLSPPASPFYVDETPPLSPNHDDNRSPATISVGCHEVTNESNMELSEHSSSVEVNYSTHIELSGLSGLSNIRTPECPHSPSASRESVSTEVGDTCESDGSETCGDDSEPPEVCDGCASASGSPEAYDGSDFEITGGRESEGRTSSECEERANEEVVDLTNTNSPSPSKDDNQPSHPRQRLNSAQTRKKLRHPKEIVRGADCVSDLTLRQLKEWMYMRKPLLVNIFKRLVYSQRHEIYVTSGHKKRESLKYEADMKMFTSKQVDVVTSSLLHIFCSKDMKYFSYVMSVLLPECLIRILADVKNITFDQAQKMIIN